MSEEETKKAPELKIDESGKFQEEIYLYKNNKD